MGSWFRHTFQGWKLGFEEFLFKIKVVDSNGYGKP